MEGNDVEKEAGKREVRRDGCREGREGDGKREGRRK